jgi:hypothetical protein
VLSARARCDAVGSDGRAAVRMKMNDEARMTNDDGMTKPEDRGNSSLRASSFLHSFVIRHSDFVIEFYAINPSRFS